MQDIRAAPRFSALLQNYRAAHSFFFRGEAARAAERIGVFFRDRLSPQATLTFCGCLHLRVRALCIYALLRLFRKRKMQDIRAAPRFSALLQNYRVTHSFFFRGVATHAARMKSGVFFLFLAVWRLSPLERIGCFLSVFCFKAAHADKLLRVFSFNISRCGGLRRRTDPVLFGAERR